MSFVQKNFLFLGFLFLWASLCQGQDSLKSFSIAFEPLYFTIHAARIDLEVRIGRKGNHWLVAPVYYAGVTNRYEDQRVPPPSNIDIPDDFYEDKIQGIGVESLFKHTFYAAHRSVNFYLALGGGFHHIDMKYQDFGLVSYMEDGLEYFEYKLLADQEETIERLDVVCLIGQRGHIFRDQPLFYEVFMGPVARKAFISSTTETPRNHDKSIFDLGYEGVTFRVGFSLGLSLF